MPKETKNTKILPKIAIFDLTDCEGCELEFLNLREKLTALIGQVEFANWRLGSSNINTGPFDVTFIEGTPISEVDIQVVKQARAASRVVISLGSCADLGGIQCSIGGKGWKDGIRLVYGEKYKTTSRPPKPLSYYIDIDFRLPGCPVNTVEIERVLGALLVGKSPSEVRTPVCLECKASENTCLLLEGEPCLGPVTKGGCGAICPEKGMRCWGCFGALRGGNQKALKKMLDVKHGKERTEQVFKSFMSQQEEVCGLYVKGFVEKPAKKSLDTDKVKRSQK